MAESQRSIGPAVMFTILVQFSLNFVVTAMQELFPLFCADTQHGLGLSPTQLGTALAPLGVSLLLWPLVFPLADRRFGTLACFRFGVCIFLVVQAAIPALRVLQQASASALWFGLTAVSVLRGIAGISSFTTVSVLMNNLVRGNVGFVNGYASSCTALARALAPTTMGTVFALASRGGLPFPLDVHLPFYVLSLICVLTLYLSTFFEAPAPARPPGARAPPSRSFSCLPAPCLRLGVGRRSTRSMAVLAPADGAGIRLEEGLPAVRWTDRLPADPPPGPPSPAAG
jgi:hypothetical protein